MNPTIHYIIDQLSAAYDEDEALALAYWIVEERTGMTRTELILATKAVEIADLDDILRRLLMHEPIQYIFGHTEWLGMDLEVTPATLIPRPETAELIGLLPWSTMPLRVLDVGTGSGCIAIATKRARPMWQVEAIDISKEALLVAKNNARKQGVEIHFELRDILVDHPTAESGYSYDIVISNPPYIRESERKDMRPNVLKHEPHTALFVPENDPLLFYRAIAAQHLAPQLYLEINEALAGETAAILREQGYNDIEIHQDIYGKNRFITAAISE